MKKLIEIEVPNGKIEKIHKEDNRIIIEFTKITTFYDINKVGRELYPEIYNKWYEAKKGSYEKKLYAYRLIVAVLTNNEKNSLTAIYYYPSYYLLEGKMPKCSIIDSIVGYINSDKYTYTVVGNRAKQFYEDNNFPKFLAVQSEEIAKHISKYFGKLVFDLINGESNINYKWIK